MTKEATTSAGDDTRIVARNRKLWIETGMGILLTEGATALTINGIATKLGTSRSPFFRTFGHRRTYFKQLFDHYYELSTERVRREVLAYGGNAMARLWKFSRAIIEAGLPRLDYPFRQWALNNKQIKGYIHEMDRERIAFMKALYVDVGYDDWEAEQRAQMNYMGYLGLMLTQDWKQQIETIEQRLLFRFYFFTTPPMPEDFKAPE